MQQTVLELLGEGDYDYLTYERISARSGVARTTLYRHWPTKAELVFDLVLHDRDLPPLADTGSAASDVAALARRVVAFVDEPPAREVFPGVIADITSDSALLARFRQEFVVGAQPLIAAVVDRIAAARGHREQLPVEDLQAVLPGAALMWLHIGEFDAAEAAQRVTALIDRMILDLEARS